MELTFVCLQDGRRLYAVRQYGRELFVGTRAECTRYLEIHNQKVLEEHRAARANPRMRPYTARTYRVARKLHA